MCLLNEMSRLGYSFLVAHVNYKKRPESDKEEELVEKFCQGLRLPFFSSKINPEEYLFVKNFQSWARNYRYTFFSEVARKNKSNHVVLAHHSDDHIETYLLQKERKSLVNHWGLSAKVSWSGKKKERIWLMRPLLNTDKKKIYEYLQQKKITYSLDQSNFLPIYRRNIIRQKVNKLSNWEKMRLLEEIIAQNQNLSYTKNLLKELIKKAVKENFSLDLTPLKSTSLEIRLRLIYYWVNKNTNKEFVVKKKSIWQEIEKQLFSSKANLKIVLDNNYLLKKDNFKIIIVKAPLV